jgi:sugar phosphate isomerase/epimerase
MAVPYEFRFAVCNEVFEETDFAEACRVIKRTGWQGIEIAPGSTLQKDAPALPAARRRELRDIIISEGLEFVGFHWLGVGPDGLHFTTPDEKTRSSGWDYLRGLVDLCGDLRPNGKGGVMVFGSPNQRRATGGLTPAQATDNFIAGLRSITPQLEARGVTFLVEALPANQCDVIGSLKEAIRVVAEVGSPGVESMFDTHNAIDETEPHEELVKRYWNHIRHIHVNENDGSHPRPGGYDFKPVLQVAKDRRFDGWVSLEVFDFTYGAESIVRETLTYLRSEIDKLD